MSSSAFRLNPAHFGSLSEVYGLGNCKFVLLPAISIEAAYQKLYHKMPDEKLRNQFRDLCSKSTSELKAIYNSQIDTEALVGDQLITYIKDGADINTNNVNEITARIRTKMQQKK